MLTVYTAIYGGRDRLKPPLFTHPEVRHLCFTDDPGNKTDGVETVVAPATSGSPALAAKFHKLHPPAENSLWIDGSYQLIGDPRPVFDRVSHVGLGRHGERSCAFSEAAVCARHRLDDRSVIARQMERYRQLGFPSDWGLWEGGLIFRRGGLESVQKWQSLWWSEIRSGSRRDQLSLPYSLWKTGLPVLNLPVRSPELVRFFDHGPARV